jgi:hypothetical protein
MSTEQDSTELSTIVTWHDRRQDNKGEQITENALCKNVAVGETSGYRAQGTEGAVFRAFANFQGPLYKSF